MILPLLLALQVTPVAPIVKGTALPPPGTEEAQVMAPVAALLAALSTGDRDKIIAATIPEGAITSTRTGPDGKRQHRRVGWSEFAAKLPPEAAKVEERQGQPGIEIDDDVAMVWAPYTVLVDGKVSHCGYNHYDLIRTDAGWRILNVTYSHRTTGCTAQ
ncbi:nuclear transport factor 2 family protein [Sphingomonas sp. RS2018]